MFVWHSFTSVHVVPLPVNPLWQVHVGAAPTLFVQLAYALQPPLLVRHSFTSVHVTPLPVNPLLHVPHARSPVALGVLVAYCPALQVVHEAQLAAFVLLE